MKGSPAVSDFVRLEELSDEYQTDYDEEAVESALSDYEAFTPGSEHTEEEEEEETADTAETVCIKSSFTWTLSIFGLFGPPKHSKIRKIKSYM